MLFKRKFCVVINDVTRQNDRNNILPTPFCFNVNIFLFHGINNFLSNIFLVLNIAKTVF